MFKPHHICLSVEKIEETLTFYSALGFKELLHWHDEQSLHIYHLILDGFILELFHFVNHETLKSSPDDALTDLPVVGIKHFAFRVDCIETAKQKIIELQLADDITITQGRTGITYFFIKDPNGIFVEIVQDDRDFDDKGLKKT